METSNEYAKATCKSIDLVPSMLSNNNKELKVFFIYSKWYWLHLLPLLGLYAMFLNVSQNPVAVGSNVTITPYDTGNIAVGLWLFGPSTLFMWYPGGFEQGPGRQNGTELNISTYQLTISSVTLKNSGLYVLEAMSPIKTRAVIALDVQGKMKNDPTHYKK